MKFRNLFFRFTPGNLRRESAAPRRTRLAVESLEDRFAPAVDFAPKADFATYILPNP